MEKRNIEKVVLQTGIILMILVAYCCRLPLVPDKYGTEAGHLRSLIYMCLYTAWGFSVRNRIIHVQVRWYMMSSAALMVFWFFIRNIKYNVIAAEQFPNLTRYLWYLYYVPMLSIPLLSVLVAMLIGRPEKERLNQITIMKFAIPTVLLILLVLGNDLHQLVFTFPENALVWSDYDYGYGFGYYLVVGWIFFLILMTMLQLYRKRRISGKQRLFLLPCIPMLVLIGYLILYFLEMKWIKVAFADMTAVICLMYTLTMEIFIRYGFIQANTHYLELFDAFTAGSQITDEKYNVLLSSKSAKQVEKDILCRTKEGPVMLEDGFRLCGAPIRGGHVVWTEDMSPLLQILDELEEARENLEDSNGILEEENALKAREAHIAEQNRIYNNIQQVTAPQINLLDELIVQTKEAGTDELRIGLLKKMLIIGAYLKRRSNLVFLSDKTTMLEAKELDLAFKESMDNLELYGISCGYRSDLTEPVSAIHIMAMYDFFEKITESSLHCMSVLTVCAGKNKESIFLIINTDSATDLSNVGSESVTVCKDEDGECKLTLYPERGGE